MSDDGVIGPDYFAPRRCLREPISEIFQASQLLSSAADAHRAGNFKAAARGIEAADIPAIRNWIESLWGKKNLFPDKIHYLRIREVPNTPQKLLASDRIPSRRPGVAVGRSIIERYGWNCAYCGIPLIDRGARNVLIKAYPEVLRWGSQSNDQKHNAFMCMDNEFDHVLPHSRGGTNEPDNLVPCCAPCNCGKEGFLLEQLGLLDPRSHFAQKTAWDGLTRLTSNLI